MSQLPDDVHSIIIQYLPFRDVLLSYQQTCSQWWESASKLRIINMEDMKNGITPLRATENILRIISRRFPVISEIRLHAFSGTSLFGLIKVSFTDCRHLEMIFVDGNPLHIPCEDWLRVLKIFPKYRGLDVTQKQNSKVPIPSQEQLMSLNITHISMIDLNTPKPFLKVVLPYLAQTVTHLTVERGKDGTKALKMLIKELPKDSSITSVSWYPMGTILLWNELIEKTPKLTELRGQVTQSMIYTLGTHCLNLTKMNVVQSTFTIAPTYLTNLKSLVIYQSPVKLPKDIQLEELTTHLLIQGEPNFVKMKRLTTQLGAGQIEFVISTCPVLEEVQVQTDVDMTHIKKLVLGCPKLRFIYGANKRIKTGRVGDVIDATMIRDKESVKRPRKRYKVEIDSQ